MCVIAFSPGTQDFILPLDYFPRVRSSVDAGALTLNLYNKVYAYSKVLFEILERAVRGLREDGFAQGHLVRSHCAGLDGGLPTL